MPDLRRWRLFGVGGLLILAGATLAYLVQTSGGVAVREVRFPADSGLIMSGALYTPSAATTNRAPAVLVSHGYLNSRETQSPFAIELARRGVVVLAMDMTGHGSSGGRVGAQYLGGPAALAYLRSLAVVDTTAIGMEGHSLGGAPLLAAAAAMPNGYRSMVLVGSTTGVFGEPRMGTPTFPRNLAVVFGQYDEFARLMWQVTKGSEAGQSERMRVLFGTPSPVLPDRLYGSIDSGTARVLHLPAITHPAEHFSRAAVGHVVDWFQRTLPGVAPHSANEQVWFWKEIGTLLALVGFVLLLLGTVDGLLDWPFFASLKAEGSFDEPARTGRWWVSIGLTTLIPALTYLPLMRLGARLEPNALFPQRVMNHLVVWAVANALMALAVSVVLQGSRRVGRQRWGKSLLLALAVMTVGYGSLQLVHGWAGIDYRFWVLGLKPLTPTRFRIALSYLPFWVFSYLLAMRGLQSLATRGGSAIRHYASAALAMSLGFVLFLVAQYGSLLWRGVLLTPLDPLDTIIAIQLAPLLAVVGLIGAFTIRRTNRLAPGALICAMLVTWYIAAGAAINA